MISVLGAGAFGTALAIAFGAKGPVRLWARDAASANEMTETRQNSARLPGADIPHSVTITSTIPSGSSATLLAIPTQKLRGFLEDKKAEIDPSAPLITCCKGIELTSGKRPSEIMSEIFPQASVAVLTGPSFAVELAMGVPIALTLACADADEGKKLQTALSSQTLRLYRTQDVLGAELGGALKNVMAIACGAAIGARLGESATAALMTRGFAEMSRLAAQLGANPVTLNGLSGFGDLVLTCSSDKSRNYRYGLALGQGISDPDIGTVEGVATAHAMCKMAAEMGLDLPITEAVSGLCKGDLQVTNAIHMLLSRPLKEETC